ncbi:hypothetical protein NKR23_g4865 [Pleurostoma richardsiae]|uniref:Letm1 RBD domain-containing protein n=1 Tax=Pleurostoma richardsiae TaxID=41990 RepID=A0AA38VRJ2_9PEZI|nr:hypothetical protein NKR23_g4865 [Pleurostoma richardsiae]
MPLAPSFLLQLAGAARTASSRAALPLLDPRPSTLLPSRTRSSRQTKRSASTSSFSSSSTPADDAPKPTPTLTTATTTLSPAAANPPASTRPPHLALPTRSPTTSTASHLFATGKAYLAFYKSGLHQIYLNTRLVWSLRNPGPSSSPSPVRAPGATTRSAWLLRARWRHDVRRVPLFALLLLVCGELTPFAVLALPGAVPLTCRIPRQVEQLRRRGEARRADAFGRLAEASSSTAATAAGRSVVSAVDRTTAVRHVARVLGLVSRAWDHVPGAWALLGPLAERRARMRVHFLAQDDALLAQAGGVPALEAEEVRLACEDRGLDVLGKDEGELPGLLARWLELSGAEGEGERARRVCALLMLRPEEWPEEAGKLDVPGWEL